jgi:hypothetical protein
MLQISAAKMGWARRSKNREEEQQEHGFELWCGDILGERVKWGWRGKWRAKGGPSPCHGAAKTWPRHHVVRWHGGSPWGVPGASLPNFWHKNLKRIFQNFSRNFYFRGFFSNWLEIKNSGKRIWNDRKWIQTKSIAALIYFIMRINSGNKSEQGGSMNKEK